MIEVTQPPKKFQEYEWHWLWSERASKPVCSQWLHGDWYSSGEAGSISPREMYRRGWRYLTFAPPPLTPHDDIPEDQK